MTHMRRVTLVIPEFLDKEILALKKEDRFIRCSYAEVARHLLKTGLLAMHPKDPEEALSDTPE